MLTHSLLYIDYNNITKEWRGFWRSKKTLSWIFVQNPIQMDLVQYKVLHITFELTRIWICISVQVIKHLEIRLKPSLFTHSNHINDPSRRIFSWIINVVWMGKKTRLEIWNFPGGLGHWLSHMGYQKVPKSESKKY